MSCDRLSARDIDITGVAEKYGALILLFYKDKVCQSVAKLANQSFQRWLVLPERLKRKTKIQNR